MQTFPVLFHAVLVSNGKASVSNSPFPANSHAEAEQSFLIAARLMGHDVDPANLKLTLREVNAAILEPQHAAVA